MSPAIFLLLRAAGDTRGGRDRHFIVFTLLFTWGATDIKMDILFVQFDEVSTLVGQVSSCMEHSNQCLAVILPKMNHGEIFDDFQQMF